MKKIDDALLPIDYALAKRICDWHKTDDVLLFNTIALTSFALQHGHSCLSLHQCLHQQPYNALTQNTDFCVETWLSHLAQFDLTPTSNSPVILENDRVYLRRYWQYENEVAKFIAQRQHANTTFTPAKIKTAKQLLTQFFPDEPSATNATINWQKVAAANTLLTSLSIIVGGPGTGKTYTVTRLLALLCSLSDTSLTIKLAAPTGKAAQRLAESIQDAKADLDIDLLVRGDIPNDAQTLHRLLGVIHNQNGFRRNQDNPIDADVLVIDEVSMVDLPLMAKLCRAIKPSCKVILLGDANQLPSVAAGSVLTDLMPTQNYGYSAERAKALQSFGLKVPVQANVNQLSGITQLLVSRRFHDNSGIGHLARAVIASNTRQVRSALTEFDDIQLLPASNLAQTLSAWASTYYQPISQLPDVAAAFKQLKAFRILAAHKEGERGVIALNTFLVNRLNRTRQPFYKGQPIMVTQNHYGINLFNGDIGLVWPNDDGQLMAWFEHGEQYRAISTGRLPNFETVYAMTIHKTQGSEFNKVALVLPDAPSPLLTRELLYTGLTRAKTEFECLGDISVLEAGVRAQVRRWAGLADKLYT